MTKIVDEKVYDDVLEPKEYARVLKESSFDSLIDLFGDDHLITALIREVRKSREQITSLQNQLAEKDALLLDKAALIERYENDPKSLIAEVDNWQAQCADLVNAVDSLKAENSRLRDGLGKLEWCVFDGVDERTQCPSCEQYNPESQHEDWVNDLYGHKPDCWLKALIGDGE